MKYALLFLIIIVSFKVYKNIDIIQIDKHSNV